MNTAINQNIVHESESQRQFARIKIPATLKLTSENGVNEYTINDISAGGFSYVGDAADAGKANSKGSIAFDIDGMQFILPVEYDAKSIDKSGRVSCSFTNMLPQQVSSLRHLISAYLNGDMVSSGDMLNVMTRDNFTKARAPKSNEALSGFARIKAVMVASLFLLLGVSAASYIGYQLYQDLFTIKSTAGVVETDHLSMSMPRDGVVNLLVASGDQVSAGQVIGRFESPVAAYLDGTISEELIQSGALNSLTKAYYKGPIVSPCDCIVDKVVVTDGQYASGGSTLFTLNNGSTSAYVMANFQASDMEYLNAGKPVTISINGSEYTGKISDTSIPFVKEGLLADVLSARVTFDETDGLRLVGKPAEIKTSKY